MFAFLQELNEIPLYSHLSFSRCLQPQEQRKRKRNGRGARPLDMSVSKVLEEGRPEESRAGGGFHIYDTAEVPGAPCDCPCDVYVRVPEDN